MTVTTLIIAGLFLPLFPLSMVFNSVFSRVTNNKFRNVALLLWPQIGLFIIYQSNMSIPDWVAVWGLLTALLYGFRLLTIRELGLWTSFIATSAWALLWVTLSNSGGSSLYLYALGISIPLVLLTLLSAELTKRFGAAYVGLYGGLALTQPRFSGVLVMVILAVIATPVFPAFFVVLHTIIAVAPSSILIAAIAGIVWLFWTWAGVRVLQGLIVGPAKQVDIPDLCSSRAWGYSGALVGLVIVSLFLVGGLP